MRKRELLLACRSDADGEHRDVAAVLGDVVDQPGEGTVDELDAGAQVATEITREVNVHACQLPGFRIAPGDAVVVGPDAYLQCFGGDDAVETAAALCIRGDGDAGARKKEN